MNINDYKNEKMLYSWPVIIVVLIVFWPVGIYLVYKRIKIDKKAGFTTSKIMRYGSYVSFLFSVTMVSSAFDSGFASEDIGGSLFYLVAGIVLYLFSKKLDVKAKKYKKYISIIINGNEVILDNIAVAMSLSTIEVRRDLKDMIDKGYFKGAYINEGTNEIVLAQKSDENPNEYKSDDTKKIETRVVTCKCCGAQNKVTTSDVECEYCASPL